MPITDPFKHSLTGLDSPVSHALPVTPSDTEDLPVKPRYLMVASRGLVSMVISGVTVPLFLEQGVMYGLRPTRIHATGTNPHAGLVALW